ncbi:hypothetical protein RhoFW510R10_12095 [Rhodanobacter sp. FW510-R10]|nr:hypothetical protein RhoFW510R10_12095 [Rhodanobacter sp. FW510-R10]
MRPRTIVYWDRDGRDGELVGELDRFQARSRGARLKYLARLGLLVEAKGGFLEGRRLDGALVLPSHGGYAPAPPLQRGLEGTPEPVESANLDDLAGSGLDGLLAAMEEV